MGHETASRYAEVNAAGAGHIGGSKRWDEWSTVRAIGNNLQELRPTNSTPSTELTTINNEPEGLCKRY